MEVEEEWVGVAGGVQVVVEVEWLLTSKIKKL